MVKSDEVSKMNEDVIRLLEEIEEKLDELNGEYGTEKSLCLFCGSKEYNSIEGVAHKKDCIIRKIREFLLLNKK